MKMPSIYILFMLLLAFSQCTKDPSPLETKCDELAIFGDDDYNNARSDEFEIDSMWLSNGCLTVRYWYGGGCGDSEMTLVGSRDKTLPLPPSISARLSFQDRDNCEAYIRTQKSFDITPFQQSDSKTITIKIDGRADIFQYNY